MQKIHCLTTPTPVQIQSLYHLYETCRSFEPISINFPKDGDLFLFISDGSTSISCLIVCKVQTDVWECYALTHPRWRKKGLCRKLLEHLCQITPEDTELVFLSDHKSPDALAAFLALDMELWHREYQMERSIDEATPFSSSLVLVQENIDKKEDINKEDNIGKENPIDREENIDREDDIGKENLEENGQLFFAYLSANSDVNLGQKTNVLLGSCRILMHNPMRFYLHHVEITKEFRNQGWGTQLIQALIQTLPKSSTLFLHVSSDNKAALKLYKKTGFHIAETLSYYLY